MTPLTPYIKQCFQTDGFSSALSCEDLNKESGVQCEWRYNTCASACPSTCQHPEPLSCPVTCVEGCHAVCPPGTDNSHLQQLQINLECHVHWLIHTGVCLNPSGQLLDEVLRKCVEPSQCQVCVHNGQRVSHGKQFILNHEDSHLCQIWCETVFFFYLNIFMNENLPLFLLFHAEISTVICRIIKKCMSYILYI